MDLRSRTDEAASYQYKRNLQYQRPREQPNNRLIAVLKLLLFISCFTLLVLIFKPYLMTYTQCIQHYHPNASPEYVYTIVRHTDVSGDDLMHVQARDLEVVKTVCDMFPNCAGFNSNGWLKTKVSSRVPGPADLYIKSEKKSPVIQSSSSHFSGSTDDYKDMMTKMKIYIYETNIGSKHRTVRSGGYGIEKALIEQLTKSHLRTRKPEEATFFFLPIRCSSYILSSSLEQEGIKMAKEYIGDMIEQIRTMYPYWDRAAGADHFYVCAHDIGAGIGDDLLKNAIALVNTADYEDPYFMPHKDISLPPNPAHGPNSLPALGKGGSNFDREVRTILAFFAGDLTSGRIRPALHSNFVNDPSFTIIDQEVTMNVYLKYLRQSRFCLVPRGREVWSPRLMDAIFTGCVPVILSDHYHLPLQGIVNWSDFAVIIPESQILQLKSILMSIPDSKLNGMQNKLTEVYSYFVWNNPSEPHDAFYSVMYELWQRRHVVRYRASYR